MASITINATKKVNGRVSFVRALDKTEGRPKFIISGQLATHRYFEEIFHIETDRFEISGVEVVQENFGSEDFDIIYSFTARNIKAKGGETNLTELEIKNIENKIYTEKGALKNERRN